MSMVVGPEQVEKYRLLMALELENLREIARASGLTFESIPGHPGMYGGSMDVNDVEIWEQMLLVFDSAYTASAQSGGVERAWAQMEMREGGGFSSLFLNLADIVDRLIGRMDPNIALVLAWNDLALRYARAELKRVRTALDAQVVSQPTAPADSLAARMSLAQARAQSEEGISPSSAATDIALTRPERDALDLIAGIVTKWFLRNPRFLERIQPYLTGAAERTPPL